mgnify:CR=1 FL=1
MFIHNKYSNWYNTIINRAQNRSKSGYVELHHIIPKSRGGEDTWENLVVACSTCNTKKGDIPLEQTGMRLAKKPKAHYNKMQIALSDFSVSEWVEYTF